MNNQMTVLAAIQQKHAGVQKLQAEELYAIHVMLADIRKGVEIHESQNEGPRAADEGWDKRIGKLVSGFSAFLREAKLRD